MLTACLPGLLLPVALAIGSPVLHAADKTDMTVTVAVAVRDNIQRFDISQRWPCPVIIFGVSAAGAGLVHSPRLAAHPAPSRCRS